MTRPVRTYTAVVGYGAAMLGSGVLVLVAPVGAAGLPAPARTVSAAPVLAPATTPTATTSVAPSGPVVVASEGVEAAARTSFVPTGLTLWNGRRAPVVRSEVRSDGSLVIPDDPAVVGWWTGGAKAGDAFGTIVIAGHVDTARQGIGILAQLVTARPGEVVTLADGADRSRYRIVSSREIKKADLPKEPSIFDQNDAHRLVLITCGGKFDPVKHHYEDNLVVEAVPV